MILKCPHCQAPMPPVSRTCWYCGEKLSEKDVDKQRFVSFRIRKLPRETHAEIARHAKLVGWSMERVIIDTLNDEWKRKD